MEKLIQRIKCLFGFHGKGRWQLSIVDVRYESHSIDYTNEYRCQYCEKIISPPIDNE